ncbi:MAG: hypothetical protein Q7J01_05080 [Syntrophales bacterium]|nr:hypothetical protein [Syntrophales bacterium]
MFQQVRRVVWVGLVLAVVVVLIPGLALGGGTISIVGEVNDDFQIITDKDQVFEIMTDDKGEELIGHAGERVKVTGEVVEEGADRSIKVLSYEVLK